MISMPPVLTCSLVRVRPTVRRARGRLHRVVVVAFTLLLAATSLTMTAAPAHAGLTPRTCSHRVSGDGNYRLDFCVRGWIDATNDHTRAVVEMHTYRYVAAVPGHWVDSPSQSITVDSASVGNYRGVLYAWGAKASKKCRINHPTGGRVGCTAVNTSRVAFFSPDNAAAGTTWWAGVYEVSWRDASGAAHRVSRDDRLALIDETWFA